MYFQIPLFANLSHFLTIGQSSWNCHGHKILSCYRQFLAHFIPLHWHATFLEQINLYNDFEGTSLLVDPQIAMTVSSKSTN